MSHTDPKQLFATTPVVRLFLTAALPGAAGMLVSSIYGTMDGVFVGNYVGETAFAAINLAMPFVIILFAFGDLIGVGSSVPISIALGEGRDDDANNVFTCSCIANVVMGGVMGAALWTAAPMLMAAMGATGELASDATTYLRVYAGFAPLTTICYALDNYLRISGRIRRSLFANTFMAVFGAVIEFVLLGVFHLRVGAAALSYCLAMASSAAIAFWPFWRGRLQLRLVPPRPTPSMFRTVAACGFSTFLDNVAGRVTSIALNAALLAAGGADAVSTYGILMFVDGIIVPLIYGMVDALQPAVGYNWGACDFGRVKSLELLCFGFAALVSLASFAGVLALPGPIVRVFVPDASPKFMAEATAALRIFALALTLRWLVFATQSFLTAVGEVPSATAIALSAAITVPLPLIVVLRPLGLLGLWLNMPITTAATSLLCVALLLRFRTKVRTQVAAGAKAAGTHGED